MEAFATDHVVPSLGYHLWRGRRRLAPAYAGLPRGGADRPARAGGGDLARCMEDIWLTYCGDTGPGIFEMEPRIFRQPGADAGVHLPGRGAPGQGGALQAPPPGGHRAQADGVPQRGAGAASPVPPVPGGGPARRGRAAPAGAGAPRFIFSWKEKLDERTTGRSRGTGGRARRGPRAGERARTRSWPGPGGQPGRARRGGGPALARRRLARRRDDRPADRTGAAPREDRPPPAASAPPRRRPRGEGQPRSAPPPPPLAGPPPGRLVEEIPVQIEKLVAGGEGLARFEGVPIFVPRSAPGDLLQVRIVERGRTTAGRRSSRSSSPGPARRPDPVPELSPLRRLRPPAPGRPHAAAAQGPGGPRDPGAHRPAHRAPRATPR